MRYLYYYYNIHGALILSYHDDYVRVERCYVFYSLLNAVSKFREEFGLQRKHIKIKPLY